MSGASMAEPESPAQGVNISYYSGSWTSLPAFAKLTPSKTDVVADINFTPGSAAFATSGVADNLGAVLTGFIRFPTAGVWKLHLTSDEGSALYMGMLGKVISNNGVHTARTV